jgi:erythromycin esterase-like protein
MGARGELNVGQLARQRYGRECVLVGLTTYDGRVTAASDWGGAAERKHVRPALGGSYEAMFHEVGSAFWTDTADPAVRAGAVSKNRRADGVSRLGETNMSMIWPC